MSDKKIGLKFPLFRMATVVTDDDSNAPAPIIAKHGNVQVQILPELADIDGSKCPWAMPWSASKSGAAQDVGDHNPPEKGSLIWIRIEDVYFREIYYLDAAPFATDFYPYKNMSSKIKVDGSYSPTYPQPRFRAMPDGSIIFWDTETSDMGIQHSLGAYLYMKNDGSVLIYGSDGNDNPQSSISLNPDGSIVAQATDGSSSKTKEGSITLAADGSLVAQGKDGKAKITLDSSGKIDIETSSDMKINCSGDMEVDSSGDLKLSATGSAEIDGASCKIKATGSCEINAANAKITGGMLTINGTAAPTGSGPFCGLPACLFTGAPHVGNLVSGD
jgi:hypothetical protein